MQKKRSEIVPKKLPPYLPGGWSAAAVVTFEKELPYPFVHYPPWMVGAVFGFQEKEGARVYVCECQRGVVEAHRQLDGLESRRRLPKVLEEGTNTPIEFRPALCHICNQVPPAYAYMPTSGYYTKFLALYGFYITGEFLKRATGPAVSPLRHDPRMRESENEIRERIGYYRIGERWRSETDLLKIIRVAYPQYTVLHQFPISNMRIDIYLAEAKLAVEYHGEQHYRAIAHFGGEEAFREIKERDEEKAELCKRYGVRLVCFRYDEELTHQQVTERLDPFLRNG